MSAINAAASEGLSKEASTLPDAKACKLCAPDPNETALNGMFAAFEYEYIPMCSVPPIDAIATLIGFFCALLIIFFTVLSSLFLALTTTNVGSSIALATPTRSEIFILDFPLAIVYK